MKTELLETAHDSVILRKFLNVALFNCYKSCRQERGGVLCVLVLLSTDECQNQRESYQIKDQTSSLYPTSLINARLPSPPPRQIAKRLFIPHNGPSWQIQDG